MKTSKELKNELERLLAEITTIIRRGDDIALTRMVIDYGSICRQWGIAKMYEDLTNANKQSAGQVQTPRRKKSRRKIRRKHTDKTTGAQGKETAQA